MKYSSYPSYRDSGVEWLGEIPSEWNIAKHKYIVTFSKGKNPSKLHDDAIEGTIKYLSMDYLRGLADPLYGEIESNSYIVEDSQPLIIWDGSNAGEFVLGVHGILSSTMAASTLLTRKIDKKYYWYVCKTIEPEMRKHSNGMGIPHVNGVELRNINLLHPSLKEQQTIANYLDTATNKIDTLITKQTKLIALLGEKRQALISTAVTKGLDSSVAMKDSGVEWLGKIPNEWKIVRNKQAFSFEKNLVGKKSKEYTLLSLTLQGIKVRDIESGKGKFPAEFDTYQAVEEKDIVFCLFDIDETPRTVGLSKNRGMITGAYNVARCNIKTVPEYMYYYYLSIDEYKGLKPFYTGLRKVVRTETFLNIQLALPNYQEQQTIANYLDDKTLKIDTLISKSTKAIELLKEKRTALISSAVTGKIDVREAA